MRGRCVSPLVLRGLSRPVAAAGSVIALALASVAPTHAQNQADPPSSNQSQPLVRRDLRPDLGTGPGVNVGARVNAGTDLGTGAGINAGAAVDAGAAATAPGACRPDARVEVNLATWKNALKRAANDQRRAEVLRDMKLAFEPTDADADGDGVSDNDGADVHRMPGPQITLRGIDDFVVPLGSGELPEHVIQARYAEVEHADRAERSSVEKAAAIYLIQVLRPLGGNAWCALGSELSRRDQGPNRLETYSLGFVHLLDAKTKAIEVEIVETELRHNEAARQYWIADGFRLRKVFDQEVGSLENVNEGRDTVAKTGKLTLAGAFPKRIELKQVTKRTTCDAATGDSTCDGKEQATSQTFMYNGRNYVSRR